MTFRCYGEITLYTRRRSSCCCINKRFVDRLERDDDDDGKNTENVVWFRVDVSALRRRRRRLPCHVSSLLHPFSLRYVEKPQTTAVAANVPADTKIPQHTAAPRRPVNTCRVVFSSPLVSF